MIRSVLVVCVGNICRSPLAEQMLSNACPDLKVGSAGISALVDHNIDETVKKVARERNIEMKNHKARQLDSELAQDYDLILAMEKAHVQAIAELAPTVRGKTMLLGQWVSQSEIPDPYRKSEQFHEATFNMIAKATESWSAKLGHGNV